MNTFRWTFRYIILIITFCTLVFTGTVLLTIEAHAQTDTAANTDTADTSTNIPFRNRIEDARSTTSDRRDQLREGVASRTDIVRGQIEERRDEIRNQLRDRIKNLLGNIKRRMNAAIERIGNIADRIESRVEKLSERGVDESLALQFIEEARSELREASAIINNTTDAEMDTVIDSDRPRDAFASIKERIREAAGHIRSAHQALRSAVAALKEAVREAQGGGGVSDAVQNDSSDNAHIEGDEHDEHADAE